MSEGPKNDLFTLALWVMFGTVLGSALGVALVLWGPWGPHG